MASPDVAAVAMDTKNSRSPTPDPDSLSGSLGPPPIKIQLSSPGGQEDKPSASSPPAVQPEQPATASPTAAATPAPPPPPDTPVKVIPRLVDSAGQAAPMAGSGGSGLDP